MPQLLRHPWILDGDSFHLKSTLKAESRQSQQAQRYISGHCQMLIGFCSLMGIPGKYEFEGLP